MTRTQQFIEKYKKVLTSGADFFNPDTTLMSVEDFEKAKCKILLILPTPHVVKTVSSTVAAINDFIIEHCPDTFLDVAYMPENEDIKHYDSWNVPYAIGNITHLDASHFDIVGFSISVLNEVVTAPVIMSTFNRCDKPIPLFWSQRKDCKLGEHPIMYAGGITAVCGESMFGKVNVGGKVEQAYMDFMYLGDCGHTHHITNRFIESMATGKCTRKQEDHDVPGYPHSDIEGFESVVKVETIQDFTESLFDLQEIYHPQAYEVEYNKHNQIIKNIKINAKARDFVTPYYPHIMEPDLGIGRAVINANGDNCLMEGTRVWTDKGLLPIESVNNTKVFTGREYVGFQELKPSKGEVLEVKLNQGNSLKATPEHLQFVWDPYQGIKEVCVGTLKKGDWVLQHTGNSKGRAMVGTSAYFAGLWYGDGYRAGGSAKWLKDYYIAQCVAVHEKNLIDIIEDSEFHEIKSGTTSVRCFGLHKDSKLSKFIHNAFPNYKDDISSVLAWDDVEQLSFLRGLFDADGTLDKEGSISLAMKESRRRVLEDIVLLLNKFGIRAHFMIRTTRAFDSTYGKCEIKIVGEQSYKNYFDFIGFTQDSKNVLKRTKGLGKDKCVPPSLGPVLKVMLYREGFRENIWAKRTGKHLSNFLHGKNGCCLSSIIELAEIYHNELLDLFKEGYSFTQVESVESIGVHKVYDVKNVNGHRFKAETFITHNCGTTQTQVSEGCSAGGACSFCSEGNYTGGWVEKEEDQIMWELREAKKYSAGYKYKPYSFNANYVKDYKGKLAKFIQLYPKVTFINMRMEELGRDVDALKMMKLIGSNRISAPMEGMSPRLQNNLLNKCLSEESLQNFMDDMVHARMTDIKVGGIFTGYEEEEDFQWICDFVDKFKERAAKEGGNFPFRLKMTPLVHYPLTPIEYLERKSARKSYEGEHWLTDEWYEKFREHQVFFKVNGFRYSTFLEQTFVDLGRSLTSLIYKHFVSQSAPIYSLRSCATDEYIADLKAMVDKEVYFADRDPEKYISPCHRIHIELMGSYIPRARRLLRHKKAGNIFANEPDVRCLKTFEGAKVKCYHSCIVKDPLKMYYDVTMDEEGNLHGESFDLTGCRRCPTKERRMERLAREIVQTKNSDDIVATRRMPQVQKIRFVLKRNEAYDCLNPNNTAHTFMTKFLQASDNLLDSYHSIVCHNMFWQCDPGFKFFTSGYQIVDTMWSKNVIKEVKSLIDEVNSKLKSVQVVSAEEILRDEKIAITDLNFYTFESSIPREVFDAACHTYKGQIKVEAQVQGFALTETIDSTLDKPVFASKGGKTIGCFWIPAKYNPIMYLSGFLSQAKKTSEDGVVTTTSVSCVMTMRETRMACKNCSKEKALISITTGKPMPFGPSCLCKAILTQMIK